MGRFSPRNTYLAYGTNSSSLKVYLTQDLPLESSLPALQFDKLHMGSVFCLDFSQDEARVVTCSNDSTVKLVDFNRRVPTVIGHHQGSQSSRSVCFFDRDTAVLSCGEDGSLHIWDIEKQEKRAEFGKGRLGVLTCVKDYEGRVYSCGLNRTVVQVDPRA
jgi:WD40 repeat protein